MAKEKICTLCSEPIIDLDKENIVKDKTKTFHKDCYDKHNISGNTSADFMLLKDYLNEGLVLPQRLNKTMTVAIWKHLTKVIENVHSKNDMSYRGMLATLRYMVEVLNYELKNETITYISSKYYDAFKYYKEIQNAQNYAKKVDVDSYINLERTVYIKKQETKPQINIKEIDIGDIEVDEEEDDIR